MIERVAMSTEGTVRRPEGAEPRRLKKLLAEAMLNNALLKDVASKEW